MFQVRVDKDENLEKLYEGRLLTQLKSPSLQRRSANSFISFIITVRLPFATIFITVRLNLVNLIYDLMNVIDSLSSWNKH